jgi:hypothetical protein
MTFEDLVGKTVVSARHIDNDTKGVVLLFNDGTLLEVTEGMQAGQLSVWLNQEHCGSGDNCDDF